VLGTAVTFDLSNSAGVFTAAVALFGTTPIEQRTSGYGDLLVEPSVVMLLLLPADGSSCDAWIPDDPAFVGAVVVLQVIELDQGAARRLSFTRGLHLTLGR
jgi:hypothetical protein